MSGRLRRLKPYVPGLVWRVGGLFRNYLRRLRATWNVACGIRGISFKDKLTVTTSLIVSPFRLMSTLDQWRDPVLLTNATVRSKNLGVFHVRGNSDDLVHVLPAHDLQVYRAVERLLGTGDSFIDGGANVGAFSVLAARIVGDAGTVHAIEMHPETFAALSSNVALNGLQNVTLFNKALSSESGKTMAAKVGRNRFGQASLSTKSKVFSDDAAVSFNVDLVTLDEVAQSLGRVALIKLDLEGYELAALQGAEQLLKRTDHLIFELWDQRDDAAISLLSGQGFSCTQLNERNVLATRVG